MNIIMLVLLFCFILSYGHQHGHHNNCGTCYAQIDNLNFGEYNPLSNNVVRSESLLRVKCNFLHACTIYYTVKLVGGNSNDSFTRYMLSPSTGNKIYYYLVADHQCRWGDGTKGTCLIYGSLRGNSMGDSKEAIHVITGVIPPMQNVSAAHDYQDSLTVIVEY